MLAILSIASWEVGLDGHLGNLLAPYRQLREGTETRTSKEKAVPGA